MDDQLVIDSSGAWVRKTVQLITEKSLLYFRDLRALLWTVNHKSEPSSHQHEYTYIELMK